MDTETRHHPTLPNLVAAPSVTIEMQSSRYVSDDGIEQFEDAYGRVTGAA